MYTVIIFSHRTFQMGLFPSQRNFGYGKNATFAGKNALRSMFGEGHFSTVGTHVDRWRLFTRWAREQGVRDLSQVDSQDLATAYAEHVGSLIPAEDDKTEDAESPRIAISTAQNRISTVNTVYAALRGDTYVQVSPVEYTARRTFVRCDSPSALDKERFQAAVEDLRTAGYERAAAVLELARAFGVRREEAIKADLDRWSREAARHGEINILDGTKGGRTAARWIPVGTRQQAALENALRARPAGSDNLIARGESYAAFAIDRRGEINQARAILRQHGLPGYHDARAAYACARYREITGHDAPAVTGLPPADRDVDLDARRVISVELGHGEGRIDVLGAYVGGRR